MTRSTAGSSEGPRRRARQAHAFVVLAQQLGDRRRVEGAPAGEDLEQHQAEREDVAALRDVLARELLGRHVGGRAGSDVGEAAGEAGQAEVGDADAAFRVEHDVGRLEIAVQHAAVVRRGKAGADLARDLGGALFREAADALQQPGQIFAVDQLHRQEDAAVVLADVVDAADVAVRHLARDAHFVVELGEPLRVLGDGRRQELQRDASARGGDRRRGRPRPCRRGRARPRMR